MKILNLRSFIILLVGLVVAGAVGKWIGGALGERDAKNHMAEKRESVIEKSLLETTNEINKTLPKIVEKDVRFDSMATANRTLSYNYTLLSPDAVDMPKDTFIKVLEPMLANQICNGEKTKIFAEHGVTTVFTYFNKEGKQIAAVTITPERCKSI